MKEFSHGHLLQTSTKIRSQQIECPVHVHLVQWYNKWITSTFHKIFQNSFLSMSIWFSETWLTFYTKQLTNQLKDTESWNIVSCLRVVPVSDYPMLAYYRLFHYLEDNKLINHSIVLLPMQLPVDLHQRRKNYLSSFSFGLLLWCMVDWLSVLAISYTKNLYTHPRGKLDDGSKPSNRKKERRKSHKLILRTLTARELRQPQKLCPKKRCLHLLRRFWAWFLGFLQEISIAFSLQNLRNLCHMSIPLDISILYVSAWDTLT